MSSPLDIALANKRFDAVTVLVRHGAVPRKFQRLVNANDIESVEFLLVSGCQIDGNDIYTVMSLEMAHLLTKHGLTWPTEQERMFLFAYNLCLSEDEIIDFYVSIGFNLKQLDRMHQSHAIGCFSLHFLERFVDDFDEGAFRDAIVCRTCDVVKLFYKRELLDLVDTSGDTPLARYVRLVFAIDIEMIQLLKTPWNISLKDSNGQTPYEVLDARREFVIGDIDSCLAKLNNIKCQPTSISPR